MRPVAELRRIGEKLVLELSCHNCDLKRGLENRICMGEIIDSLLEARCDVQEVVLNGIYRVTYREEHVKPLLELTEALRKLWAWAPWRGVLEAERREFLYNLLVNDLRLNPAEALEKLRGVLKAYGQQGGENPYTKVLKHLEAELSKLSVMRSELVVPEVRASFVPRLELNVPIETKLLESYEVGSTRVRIYELPTGLEHLYFLEPQELWLSPTELRVLHEAVKELETRGVVSTASAQELKLHFLKRGKELLIKLSEAKGLELGPEVEELAKVLVRYTIGYGPLEALLADEKVQDVYVDAPVGTTPVYLNHSDYDECITNLYLSQEELERVASRIRARSGRAFDASIPVVDAELELNVRVAGIREPVTFGGIAYAFRKHKERPWSLPMLMEKRMLNAKAAGLLSFLVASQQSILITGPRGCGKTSLLAALLIEVPRKFRIIVLEDTPELPVRTLRRRGWKIQHLRCASPILSEGYELKPEENLRAALRLGESVLVIGEVRGNEAKVLFEAMRIGAAGNVVLGTIHGSSPYDTWDRIVNDLGVPSTSFKATDIVVAVGYKHAIKHRLRRVMSITEVRKHWSNDPATEGGFHDQMIYDAEQDQLLDVGLRGSEVLRSVARLRGSNIEECLEEVDVRGRVKETLLRIAKERGLPSLLEADFVARANEKFLSCLAEDGPGRAYERWEGWLLSCVS